jgi:hypothetical protein
MPLVDKTLYNPKNLKSNCKPAATETSTQGDQSALGGKLISLSVQGRRILEAEAINLDYNQHTPNYQFTFSLCWGLTSTTTQRLDSLS